MDLESESSDLVGVAQHPLTTQMAGDIRKAEYDALPAGWRVVTLGEVLQTIYRYPTYYDIDYVSTGVPEVRGQLIGDAGQIEEDRSRFRHISQVTAARFPRTRL